jgi:hypothetical protein
MDMNSFLILHCHTKLIELDVLETFAGKQYSYAATDVKSTYLLKQET